MSKEQIFEALLRASLAGHTAAVKALLDYGLNLNAKDQNHRPYQYARCAAGQRRGGL